MMSDPNYIILDDYFSSGDDEGENSSLKLKNWQQQYFSVAAHAGMDCDKSEAKYCHELPEYFNRGVEEAGAETGKAAGKCSWRGFCSGGH